MMVFGDIILTTPTLGVQIRVRSGSTSFHSIPEESEFHSMGEGGVAASHRMSLADSGISHDMDAVVVGLSQFKNELLQLHALVSLFVRVTDKLGREKKKREKRRREREIGEGIKEREGKRGRENRRRTCTQQP